MAEMYLTDKLEEQNLENSTVSSIDEQEDAVDDELHRSDVDDRHVILFSYWFLSKHVPT